MTEPSIRVCDVSGCPALTRGYLCERHRGMTPDEQNADINGSVALRERYESHARYVTWLEENRDDPVELAAAERSAAEAKAAWTERISKDTP